MTETKQVYTYTLNAWELSDSKKCYPSILSHVQRVDLV